MNKIGIVTDSHSGISRKLAEELGITVLSMPFFINEACYYEGDSLSREEFFQYQTSGAVIRTSQPSPAEVMAGWDRALEEYGQIIYVPVSSGLSGSCSAAAALSHDDDYDGRVFVVDNGRVSTPLLCTLLDAKELIAEGYSAPQIKKMLEDAREDMVVYVGVPTLQYLKQGGRITPATAALGTLLNIKPVLKLDVNTLDAVKKCHGFIKARHFMIETMKQELETRFREAYETGQLYLLAASSADEETTRQWVQEIQDAFPGMDVISGDLALAVCCHTGPGALGIGCSCKPKR